MLPFKILVCGGRDYEDEEFVHKYLYRICQRISKNDRRRHIVIIEGGAKGADSFAKNFAIKFKDHFRLQLIHMPADWERYGKKAGMKRNESMADLEPNICIAFPGGVGTLNMVSICAERGIRYQKVRW